MEKGQTVDLNIIDMSTEGAGIGRAASGDAAGEGFVVFVPGAVYGDRVSARLKKVKKRYAFADLIEVTEKSPHRREEYEVCEYVEICGGCPFGKLKYGAQTELKEIQVKNKLTRIGGVNFEGESVFNPIITMSPEDNDGAGTEGYRNKARMTVSTGGYITEKGGIRHPVHEPRIGFMAGKSHNAVDCKDCRLQAETAMAAAEAVRRFMEEDNICSYDERWGKGLMEAMTVKTAFGTGEVMVILEIHGKGIPGAAKLIEYLDEYIYEAGGSLESVAIRYCDGKNAGETEILAGAPVINDEISHPGKPGEILKFEISPNSFYQVNTAQMIRLYDKVREYCFTGEERPVILDLYCGIGTIGLYLVDRAEAVLGIESVKDAVRDANRNAVINGVVNARYVCAKAEEFLPKAAAGASGEDSDIDEMVQKAAVAVMDPPRAGADRALLDTVNKIGIERVVYVSCDPATLARDVKYLGELGYKVVEATPADLFPDTAHCEAIVLLQKLQY